ncbi:MAG: MotA/TolQ/ExbB proton channel family protein [bacterium]|nr:MotA/TolQ/ExbB proton channel family protein [bacterium]
MLEILDKVGPLIYPLGLCSLLATTITIERLFALRQSRVFPREIVELVGAIRPGRDLTLAIDVCRRNPGVFADVMLAGLEQAAEPWEIMRDSLQDAGRQNAPILERRLVWLQTIAQAAPLLGLLGTVLGMIKMFASISLSGLGDPNALSAGISEAMFTTAIGLVIGIPTLVAYNLLSARADILIGEMEAHAARLIKSMRPGGEGGSGP